MILAVTGVNYSPSTSFAASQRSNNDEFAQVLDSVTGTTIAGESMTLATSAAPGTILGSTVAAHLFATPQEEQDYASELTKRQRAAGVDTSQSIQFQVESDGSEVAKDGTPDKQKIDALFAADPAFANEYRKIANTEESSAIARADLGYMNEAKDMDSASQSALWQRYAGMISNMEAHGGDLTPAGASLSFES